MRRNKAIMKMRKAFFFNMVEIALAFAIVGVGVASIMSLISVGVSSSKDAIGDNNAPMVARNFISYFEKYILSNWSTYSPSSTLPADPTFPNSLDDAYYIGREGGEPESNLSQVVFNTVTINGLQRYVEASKPENMYRYNLSSGGGGGFKCDIRVWRDRVYANIGSFSGNMEYDYATAILVEVSWPVGVAYSQRQRRYYRYEIFNPNI